MLDILTYHAAYRRETAERAARNARLRHPEAIKTATPVVHIARARRAPQAITSPTRPLAA